MINILIRIGLVRRKSDGSVRWPFHVSPWWIWKVHFFSPPWSNTPAARICGMGWCGVFRNRPGVVKWEPGRLLPRRWGFRVLGLEVGDRGA